MLGLILLFLTGYLLIVVIGTAAIVWQVVRPRRKTYAIAMGQGQPTEPGDVGLVGEEHTFNLPGGHNSPGWIITGQSANGPTILILHGHRDCRFGALLRAKQLAPYASHIVVFDWPAHGECTAPWMTCGTREPEDAVAVLDGLPESIGERPIVLFGYSLGGQIAVKTAAKHPRFVGVVLDGPYRLWDTPIRQRLKHHRVPAFPFVVLAGAVFRLFGLIKRFDRAEFAKQVTAPLLVLHGTADRVCPIEEGQQLADAAPNGTFVPIQDGPHNLLFDHDPEAYHAALRTFFDQLQTDTLAP